MNAAQAYAQLSVWSNATVGLNPWEFLTESSGGGSTKVTLKEMLGMGSHGGGGISDSWSAVVGGTGAFDMIAYNFRDNWIEATIQSTLLGVGFGVAKKLTRKPRGMANKMLKQLGMGDVVRL